MARRTAYQLITASLVIDNVRDCAPILPANEYQTRPLTKLNPVQQREVWCSIVKNAPAGKITAGYIKKQVEKLLGANKSNPKKNDDFILCLDRICASLVKMHEKLRQMDSKGEFISKLKMCEKKFGAKYILLSFNSSGVSYSISPDSQKYSIDFSMNWDDNQKGQGYHDQSDSEWFSHQSCDFEAKNPHDILGISKDATFEEIKKAYRNLSKMYHPDTLNRLKIEKNHSWINEVAETRMKKINWAKENMRKRAQ